jgi:opacity protein-like surface antigen
MRLLLLLVMASSGAFAQLSFGVRGGLPFTDFFHSVSNPGETFKSSSTRFILGPTVELHLPAGFGLEADALYRHYQYNASYNLVDVLVKSTANSAWEFPLLVKYRAPGPFVRPYFDGGVAWDRWSGVKQITQITNIGSPTNSNVSGINTGFVLGAGIELRLPLIKLSPEVRYTRWGARNITDLGGALQSNQNQAEFLLGVTF